MRLPVFILLLALPTISFGQYQYGFLKEYFFTRQPSARAEAMGRSYVSIDGDLTTSFFNPAGAASLKGIELDLSNASPMYMLIAAQYYFGAAGINIKNKFTVGFSRNHFTYGEELYFVDINGNFSERYTPYITNNCLTLAAQPVKNLFVGMNANYIIWNIINSHSPALYFDLGVIKKFDLLKASINPQSFSLGASVINFTSSNMNIDFQGTKNTETMPVIARVGGNYKFTSHHHALIDTLKTFGFLVQGEYQKLLNGKYETAIRAGLEFIFLEMFAMRFGYYTETQNTYGSSNNNSAISAITFGIGYQVPLYKLSKIPLNISIDYTSLPQPAHSNFISRLENFHTVNVKVNWLFRSKV